VGPTNAVCLFYSLSLSLSLSGIGYYGLILFQTQGHGDNMIRLFTVLAAEISRQLL
jgi:hypothetical protein